MKKLIIPFILFLVLISASCNNGENEETTAFETHPPVEITTAPSVSVEEMSPSYRDPALSLDIATKIKDINFDSFEEIEAKDSVFPDSTHDRILKSENAQYFFVEDDIKIHAVFFDENGNVHSSASYNSDTGNIEFFGDATVTWYFDGKGELEYFVYTYDFGSANSAPIYTFYKPDGTKEVTRTKNGWYTPALDLLTEEEVMAYINKYKGSIEATAAYGESGLAGLK